MPELDSTTKTKIAQLRAISQNWTTPLEVYELLKIGWGTGAVYYAATEVDELSPSLPVSPVEARIVPESLPDCFLPVVTESSLSDEEIDIQMWDEDGAIADLVFDNGEGVETELFLWFPAVGLLLSVWWGHLRTDENSDAEFWRGKAATGFRSPNLPLPRRAHFQECQAIFGGLLQTQAEIDLNDCKYNRHLGGSVGLLNGGVPYASCPRKTFAQCTARLNDKLSHLSHQTVEESIVNQQKKGADLLATSRGNETNLKRAVRVVMGWRHVRDLDLLASTPQYNNKDAGKGWWRVMFEACEGPVKQILQPKINGTLLQSMAHSQNLNIRNGHLRQPATSFSPNAHNYSGTALFSHVYGWVDPSQVTAESLSAEVWVEGLSDIKQFTSENSFYTGSTNNRAWQIFRMLTDKRWGYGLDEARLSIPSWIAAAAWAGQMSNFADPETGDILSHVRSQSDVELNERTTQQQIEDMCWAGRFSRPFLFQGKMHIVPLRALSTEELAACPVFTDDGENRNIVWEGNKSTLTRSQISDLELPNRVEITYDDSARENLEQVVSVEDVSQQLRAGRVLGDTTRRTVTKKESALGVVNKNQAIKLAWSVLDLGKFDEGGMKNNLEITFRAWFLDCLEFHPYKPIKVVSSQLERYGFQYFRIKKIERLPDLQVEITAQAYPVEYMNNFEPVPVSVPPVFFPPAPTDVIPLDFGAVTLVGNYLDVEIVLGV